MFAVCVSVSVPLGLGDALVVEDDVGVLVWVPVLVRLAVKVLVAVVVGVVAITGHRCCTYRAIPSPTLDFGLFSEGPRCCHEAPQQRKTWFV
jgi:hypothetical protein